MAEIRINGVPLDLSFASIGHSQDIIYDLQTIDAEYIILGGDNILLCDGSFTVFLPLTSIYHIAGWMYIIKNIGTGVILVDADTVGGTTLDGETSQVLSPGESIWIISDLTSYWIL